MPSNDMSSVGTLLRGRYELRDVLGHGGMARVFLGRDRALERPVAVKVLAAPFDRDPGFVERFRREARSAASLNHPNIVAVFDTGSEDGTHFIVMEYVDGPTLAEVLERQGALEPRRAAAIGASIADALEAAHAHGVVHRDVKPGNVMLTSSGTLKVVDFGIARAADVQAATHTGVVLGTAAYLSPEQAAGQPADARSDVYSLGCVLYELLTGRPPFDAESPIGTLFQHVYEPPVPPSAMRPDLPLELDRMVGRCLQKDPRDRFPRAAELAAELRAAADGDGAARALGGDTAVLEPVEKPTEPVSFVSIPERRSVNRLLRKPAFDADAWRRRWREALARALGARGRSDANAAAAPADAAPRSGPRGPLVALLAIAIVVGLVVAAMALTPDGSVRAAHRGAAGTDPRPTSTPQLAGVPDAYSALVGAIVAGHEVGAVDDAASADLMHRAQDALFAYQRGDLTAALEHIAEIRDHLRAFVRTGEVTSDAAAAIRIGAATLARAMRAAPPADATTPVVPPGHAEGHGNGHGHGNGNGHDD